MKWSDRCNDVDLHLQYLFGEKCFQLILLEIGAHKLAQVKECLAAYQVELHPYY